MRATAYTARGAVERKKTIARPISGQGGNKMEQDKIIAAIANNEVVWLEQPEFLRQQYEFIGNPNLWIGKINYQGKNYDVIYQFYEDDEVNEFGDELLAEDLPWDEEHIYQIEESELE
ncbi:TPA: hypothetical protein VBM32_002198 [Streptococcus agalactiae]|nr:hypothetical protein [Streptococcus agalactiae]